MQRTVLSFLGVLLAFSLTAVGCGQKEASPPPAAPAASPDVTIEVVEEPAKEEPQSGESVKITTPEGSIEYEKKE